MTLSNVEIDVPAPWGHIACKAWGDKKNEAALVFHGILDNAGSFDRIMDYLPNCFYYICVDLPGHGKSSHFPEKLPLHSLDQLLVYKILTQFFKRERYIIIGHSYGGQLGLLFSQIYPDNVSKLVMFDTIYLFPKPARYLATDMRDMHSTYFSTMEKMEKNTAPTYTYEEAVGKFLNNRRYGQITREAAEPLVKRTIIPTEVENQYVLSIDQRLKFFHNPCFDFRYIGELLKKSPPQCPILIILGSDSDTQRIYFRPILNILKRNKQFTLKIVEGNHDVHNVKPELVGPIVSKFLVNKKGKL